MAAAKVITVSQDGSADFKTVQEAVDDVPLENNERIVIRVKPGVYKQPVFIAKTKDFITLAGMCPESTVITWNNTFQHIEHHLSEDVIGKGTFGCGSFIVEAKEFVAKNITFENNAPQGSHQAVAVRASGDHSAFYNCRFLGLQDTLYLHQGNHHLRDCYIEGTVDFIFGNNTAYFEHCHLHCKSDGYVTAHKRNTADETTGYVFMRCVITGTGQSAYAHLGRPWGPYGRVLFAYSYMDSCIKPEGWDNWSNPENEGTACFYEYKCYGPGSNRESRVAWSKELEDEEAGKLMCPRFIDTDEENPWLAKTMADWIPHCFT